MYYKAHFGQLLPKYGHFCSILPQFLRLSPNFFRLRPLETPLLNIFGSYVSLGHKKHKFARFSEKMEFSGIFQKVKIFKKMNKICKKTKIMSP